MKVDTKDLNKLTKLFNGVALSVFIDYCNYCDENPDKEPTYEELAKWTGKDLSTIQFCLPFLKEQGYIKVKSEAAMKEELLFRSRVEDSLTKTVDMFLNNGAFVNNETKERCREMLKAFVEEKKNNLPTRRELLDTILSEYLEKYFEQLDVIQS